MLKKLSKKKLITFGISIILDCVVLLYAIAFSPVGIRVRGIAAGIVLAAMIAEVISVRKAEEETCAKRVPSAYVHKKIA